MIAFHRAWEAEWNEALKASIILHSSKQLKNKDLPGSGQSRSQQTYAASFNTGNNDDINESISYVDYNICSVNQFGELFIYGYDADEYDNANPNSVLIANTASNSSSNALKSKKKQPKSILLPRPKKYQIHAASLMCFLANKRGVLCDEDGTLWGYL